MKKPNSKAIARQRRLNAQRGSVSTRRRVFGRRGLLGPASALVLGSFGASAMAATTVIDLDLPNFNDVTTEADANLAINSALFNLADVEAIVTASTGGIETEVGDGTALTLDVDENVIGALATGNSFINEIELDLIEPAEPGEEEGAASIGFSLNEGVITSLVEISGFEQSNQGVSQGSFSVDDNTVIAQTTLNAGQNIAFGQMPTGYSDDSPGSITFASPAPGADDLDTEATIAVSTFQISSGAGQGAGSGATLSDNFATLSMDTDPGESLELDSSVSVDGNEFAAIFRGNIAVDPNDSSIPGNVIPIETGGNPTFEGTAALANVQANLGDSAAGTSALAEGTVIRGEVGANRPDDEEITLTGTLSVDLNRVTAAVTGNEAGNLISLEDGLSFQGSAETETAGANIVTAGTNEVDANLDADLALFNLQANQEVSHTAETGGTEISAFVTSVDGSTVTVDDNTITAQATGNLGTSRILAESANDFDGSAALASFQVNQDPAGGTAFEVASSADGNEVTVTIGDNVAAGDQLTDATISINDTTISGLATGNRVTNEVAIAGNDIDLGEVGEDATLGSLTGGQEGFSTLDAEAGASLISVQAQYSVDVETTVSNNFIGLDATVGLSENITGSSLSVSDNTLDGVAIGNQAGGNTLSLSANDLTGSAVLGSVQAIDGPGNQVTATTEFNLIENIVGVVDEVDLVDSSFDVSGNLIRGLGFGNLATNVVDIDANSATVPQGGPLTASTVNLDIANEDQAVNAAYGLLSVQSSSADVSGLADVSDVTALVRAGITSSTVSLNDNAVVGAAFGNEAINSMSLDASNLAYEDASGPVANVTSAQAFTGAVTASTEDAFLAIVSQDDVTDSTLELTGNLVQAQGVMNRAANNGDLGNTLSVTGTNINALPDDPVDGLGFDANDGELTADTPFSVQSAQVAGTDAAPASLDVISNFNFLTIDAGDAIEQADVLGSTLSLDANAVLASGTLNEVVNRVELTGITTLEGAAGLNNLQQAVADTDVALIDSSASLFVTFDGADGGNVTDSSLSASDNTFQASARGNLAANAVAVEATNVTIQGNTAAGSVIDTDGGTTDVAAAFGSLNTQSMVGDISATVDASAVELFVDDTATDSSIAADDNTLAAIARANTATSAMDLDIGNFDSVAEGPVASVTSSQTLDGAVAADLLAIGLGGAVVLDVGGFNDGSAVSSTLSVSGTTLQAEAAGNRAVQDNNNGFGNVLTVSGGSIEAELSDAAGLTMDADGDTQAADLAFSVQNRQATAADSDISAGIDDLNFLSLTVAFDVTDSTLSMNENTLSAGGVSNEASNALQMTDLNAITSSGGVQSFQQALGATEAVIDLGEDPALGVDSAGEAVTGSTLELSANQIQASATGSEVTNLLEAEANSIDAGAGQADTGFATTADGDDNLAAVADFAVSSFQNLGAEADVTASADAGVVVNAGTVNPATIVSGSTLSITENIQQAQARGNVGTNVLELQATNLGDAAGTGASGSVLSVQEGASGIDASSTFEANVTGSVEDSSVTVSANENLASAVLNQAGNQLSASGTNLFSSAANSDNAESTTLDANDALRVTADQGLANVQRAGDSDVTADATTTVLNRTQVDETSGIADSSASFTDNLTQGIATANQSGNFVDLDASTLGVTGGVLNRQDSEADVTATATSSVEFILNADGAVTTSSTIDVGGNTTVAAASGNRSDNLLSATAGAGYANVGAAGAQGLVNMADGEFSSNATFAALNAQTQAGGVAASIDNASHAIELSGNADAVTGSTLSASNNQMMAEASGNFARNTLAMSARPGGNGSAALTNLQTNNGAGISATLSNSTMGVTIDGGSISSNTASVSSNRGIARASGNTAVNRILSGD